MAQDNLIGPHKLTFDGIAAALNQPSPGVFALGYSGRHDVFYINFVGRADLDLRVQLRNMIGSDVAFKYSLAESGEAAFYRECDLFHAFRPPANRLHPSRPMSTNWVCPLCILRVG